LLAAIVAILVVAAIMVAADAIGVLIFEIFDVAISKIFLCCDGINKYGVVVSPFKADRRRKVVASSTH
jgi:hypothetical protein